VSDDELALRHSMRFRKVSNGYPRAVAQAYDLDLVRAAGDTDEQVAATVAGWEQAHGKPVRDWRAIGATERDEGDDDLTVTLDVLRAQLDAIERFVAAFADLDPRDTSPRERDRLHEASHYLSRALNTFG
jgi:hypothetical protein